MHETIEGMIVLAILGIVTGVWLASIYNRYKREPHIAEAGDEGTSND